MKLSRLIPVSLGLGVVLVLSVLVIGSRGPSGTELTVQFSDTTGLYVGNDVQVVGVPVGEVTAIAPRGTRSDVSIRVDDDVNVAADAGAVVMQSALVTDRFIELTPPWSDGARMGDGGVIPLDRTRSPANVDDVMTAIDDLVVALKDTTSDGKDIGDLLSVGADQLDGKGAKIADALEATSDALGTIDGREPELTAIVGDLDSLTAMLAERDTTVRRLSESVATSTTILAGQREDLTATLKALRELSSTTSAFVKENEGRVVDDLEEATAVLDTMVGRKAELAETFDLLPLVAENITRAYDPETRRTRIRVDVRNTGPFSAVGRAELCRLLRVIPDCDALTSPNGTGALDPLFHWFTTFFPEDL